MGFGLHLSNVTVSGDSSLGNALCHRTSLCQGERGKELGFQAYGGVAGEECSTSRAVDELVLFSFLLRLISKVFKHLCMECRFYSSSIMVPESK